MANPMNGKFLTVNLANPGGVPLWVSNGYYKVGSGSRSLLDYREYIRIIAGAGTTDPSLDATNWVIRNKNPLGQTPTAIVNAFAAAGCFPSYCSGTFAYYFGLLASTSGVMTANTLKTFYTHTGSGVLNVIGITTTNNTTRTIRVVITLDGVVAFDSTSATISSVDQGIFPIGQAEQESETTFADFVPYGSSCLIQVASSVSETDKLNFYRRYREG